MVESSSSAMRAPIVLGVDSSTSATKVIACDRDGAIVAEASASYPCTTERPGWVEQDADQWWEALAQACRTVMAALDPRSTSVQGIGLTHQRFSFVPVDADLRPLRRAILWNDTRCSQEAEEAARLLGSQHIYERTGFPPSQFTLYKVLWLKRHEPEVYAATRRILLVQDFLIHRLCGAVVMAQGSGTMTGALDIAHPDRWAMDIIEGLGIREDIWVERILPGATVAGLVHRQAAAATGLPEGLPVVTGAGDQPCGSLGAGVVGPGQLGINGGTSCSVELVCGRLPDRRTPRYFVEIGPSGDYILENCIPSGGSALMNWYRDRFEAPRGTGAAGTAGPALPPWPEVYGLAAEAPPGNDGVMLVPYFQGVNAPYWDQDARGLLFGMHVGFGKPHLVRAIIEGIAYEARRSAELMSEGSGIAVEEIRMYGGSARSDIWNQAFADVFDRPLAVPDTEEATAKGAAISAAVACGVHADFAGAVRAMVKVRARYAPDRERAARYDRLYRTGYVKLYDRIADLKPKG
jgi:sugar (pentulose or hexulose) kinase